MEKEITPSSVGLKYGLILGLASILVSAINFMLGGSTSGPSSWIGFILIIVAIVLAMREYKNLGDGFMGYGQGFSIGFFVSLISGIIGALFSYVYLKFIDDSIIEAARNEALLNLEEQGIGADNPAAGFIDMFTSPGAISAMALLGSIILGIIFTLIIAAIMKKDRPEFGM